MKNNSKIIGMMIRKYRLEQNMSQAGLCRGICAVSYLSKIEKGTIVCSHEILSKLLDVLGISIPDNMECLKIYEEKINAFFRNFFLSNDKELKAIMDELILKKDILIHSYLTIDMNIIEAYNEFYHKGIKAQLNSLLTDLLQYEEYMNNIQAQRLFILLGVYETLFNNDYEAGLKYYKLAQNRKNDGIVLESLANVYYLLGDYIESITLGDEAYRKLMDEGYLNRATNLCFTIAAAYANYRNIDKMLHYYNRILALNSLTDFQEQKAMVYYNIGSAYLANKDYIKALHSLNQAYAILRKGEKTNHYLLLLQKLILAHLGLSEIEKANTYFSSLIENYKNIPEDEISNSIKASLGWLKIMCSNEDFLKKVDYLNSIKTLYESSLKDSHHGFQMFYGNYLIEAYKAHRKYKEALQITESLYVKKILS